FLTLVHRERAHHPQADDLRHSFEGMRTGAGKSPRGRTKSPTDRAFHDRYGLRAVRNDRIAVPRPEDDVAPGRAADAPVPSGPRCRGGSLDRGDARATAAPAGRARLAVLFRRGDRLRRL